MTWPPGWHSVEAGGKGDTELRREIGPGHVLYGLAVTCVARRLDGDDVLFRVDDGSGRYAVVHLTWSGKRESPPDWPGTEVFASVDAFLANQPA